MVFEVRAGNMFCGHLFIKNGVHTFFDTQAHKSSVHGVNPDVVRYRKLNLRRIENDLARSYRRTIVT